MVRVFQLAALALVLGALALCGVACWGIYALVSAGRQVAVDFERHRRRRRQLRGSWRRRNLNNNHAAMQRNRRCGCVWASCAGKEGCNRFWRRGSDCAVAGEANELKRSRAQRAISDAAAADIHRTALAVTGTAQAGTSMLGVLADSKHQLPAAIAAYTASGNDLDALLKKKTVNDFVDNLAPLSANLVAGTATGDAMLATANQVETKATTDYLHPSKNPLKRTWQAIELLKRSCQDCGDSVLRSHGAAYRAFCRYRVRGRRMRSAPDRKRHDTVRDDSRTNPRAVWAAHS